MPMGPFSKNAKAFLLAVVLLTAVRVHANVICEEIFGGASATVPLNVIWKAETSQENFLSLKAHFEKIKEDPDSLIVVYASLTRYKSDNRFANDVARMLFEIRKTVRLWRESSDPALAKAAQHAQMFLGTESLSLAEESLLISTLSDLQKRDEAADTVRKTLETPIGPLSLKIQNEKERRVQLPKGEFTARMYTDTLDAIKLESGESIVATILWKYFALLSKKFDFRSLNPMLSFRPLGNERVHFHSGQLISSEKTNAESGAFTTKIRNNLPVGKAGDSITQDFFVTHQREIGTYYDTPAQDLFLQKIALRTKEFHSMNGQDPKAVTRVLFAKKTLDSDDLFTNRTEYEVKLPEGATDAQLKEAMRALLKEMGVNAAMVDRLQVSEVINNERYGFDLVWRNTVKIGFMTIDAFQSANASKASATSPYKQWEIEVLPEFKDLITMYPEVFSDFFKELEESFNGKLNPTPKAHQHLMKPD